MIYEGLVYLEVIMDNKHKPYGPYEMYFKRPLDLMCGLATIIIFWWLYLILIILVKVKLGSPVLFVQERPGKDEKIFKLYKFRTMSNERDENGELLPDEMRLTKFGKFLRATSLDEIPEALNLINGTLSLCGPRPLLVKYLPLYSKEQHRRHEVRPGLSGYAQIQGRNTVTWDERFKYDIEYVDKITFVKDVKIILATIKIALKREGISSETSVTMEEFTGTKG